MGLLESISGPRDLRGLTDEQLDDLATEIRDRLITTCSPRGGHLGPNLGVVELTLALHRTFDSPTDRIVFDTGHQAYVHKMLTGRAQAFDTLKQEGGLSGYPSQAESPHDAAEHSHRATASPCAGRRAGWVPAPGRAPARRRGDRPRRDRVVLRRRAGQGLRAARRGPSCRG